MSARQFRVERWFAAAQNVESPDGPRRTMATIPSTDVRLINPATIFRRAAYVAPDTFD
jgi:hypothetical protein